MKCVCGCGTRLSRRQLDTTLVAGEVAIELAIWDKARARSPAAAGGEVGELIATGAPRYQRLLAALHDDRPPEKDNLAETREWIERSKSARLRLGDDLGVPRKKPKLSEADQRRIDRLHPELSFSGGAPAAEPSPRDASELDAMLAAGGAEYERLAVAWLGRLIASRDPSLDELRWLLGRLEDVRSGRREEAEPALRRFLSERS